MVKYDDKMYPGEVKEVGDGEVKVSTMMKSEKYYKRPPSEDCIFYQVENVIRKTAATTCHVIAWNI